MLFSNQFLNQLNRKLKTKKKSKPNRHSQYSNKITSVVRKTEKYQFFKLSKNHSCSKGTDKRQKIK